MLTVTIPSEEVWDEAEQRFIKTLPHDYTLSLEHSLVSLSKWEQKWHKPFLSEEDKTYEETCDYIRCMTRTQNIPAEVYKHIPDSVVIAVNEYIKDPATATWFGATRRVEGASPNVGKKVTTSEEIYYMMIELNIPIQFEKWHLNRLFTLIKVINIKHEEADPNNKNRMSASDMAAQRRAIMAQRRKALGTKG